MSDLGDFANYEPDDEGTGEDTASAPTTGEETDPQTGPASGTDPNSAIRKPPSDS